MHPIHTFPPWSFQYAFEYNYIYAQVFQVVFSPLSFAVKILYAFLISPMRATYATHCIPFDLDTLVIQGYYKRNR
jgi:hypothetical protein